MLSTPPFQPHQRQELKASSNMAATITACTLDNYLVLPDTSLDERIQDAKARFSELVRRVRSEGPQHVTVHGRDEVVVVSAEEFRRLKGERSGDALIAAMQASPHRDIEIEPKRDRMPVRGVDL